MKILVLSDSHGRVYSLIDAISLHPDARYVFFLGDGYSDYETARDKYPDKIFYAVRGNNDFNCGEPYTRIVELCGHRMLLLHGHTAVAGGISALEELAQMNDADILLYGHTHRVQEHCARVGERLIHIFNPGSCGRGYGENTYGILTVVENNILFSVGEVKR